MVRGSAGWPETHLATDDGSRIQCGSSARDSNNSTQALAWEECRRSVRADGSRSVSRAVAAEWSCD